MEFLCVPLCLIHAPKSLDPNHPLIRLQLEYIKNRIHGESSSAMKLITPDSKMSCASNKIPPFQLQTAPALTKRYMLVREPELRRPRLLCDRFLFALSHGRLLCRPPVPHCRQEPRLSQAPGRRLEETSG